MIQRIQSLYLFLVALLTGLMFAFPIGSIVGDTEEVGITACGFRDAATGKLMLNTYGMTATIVVAALLAFVIIFLFKKRMLQFRLCMVEIVLQAGILVFEIYYLWGASRIAGGFEVSAVSVGVSALFPLLSIILTLLAIRGIMKDIRLLKSLDRIR